MKTTIFKIKIDRKRHEIDATNQAAGRLATRIATLLRGKHKVDYAPQIDNGDFVIVTNPDKLKFTGKKIEQKKYYRHSSHPGHLKTLKIKDIYKKNPQEVIQRAVMKMLPKNRLQNDMIKRLTFK